mgnify:CR=1 FL=1
MKNSNRNYYVLTGGPGTDKTTILESLKNKNYTCIPEVAREIIKDQVNKRGSALPWANKAEYAKLMWQESIRSYQSVIESNSLSKIFFDRGILDTICYMEMENLAFEFEQIEFLKSVLYKKVFILPPWHEIYVTDQERKQSWQEAIITYNSMRNIYNKYGYEVIEVPKDSVENRVQFILSNTL